MNYTLSRDLSDDDNERDPFTFRYARADTLEPEYNYSDRDQRHRFNAWLLTTGRGFEFNNRVSARSAQPRSIGNTPQDRIQPDGTIIKRNTLRKDNEFFSWDLRVTRDFTVGRTSMQPIFEVFNLTNSKNIKRPEVTNLVFNFDGTVQSGLGEPRQAARCGVRVRFSSVGCRCAYAYGSVGRGHREPPRYLSPPRARLAHAHRAFLADRSPSSVLAIPGPPTRGLCAWGESRRRETPRRLACTRQASRRVSAAPAPGSVVVSSPVRPCGRCAAH